MHSSRPTILLFASMALALVAPSPPMPNMIVPGLLNRPVDADSDSNKPQNIPQPPPSSASASASPTPAPSHPPIALHMWNFTVVRDTVTGNMSWISFSLSRVDEDGVAGNETISTTSDDDDDVPDTPGYTAGQAPAGSLPLPSTPKLHPTTNATLCESHAPTLYTSQAITCSNPLFMWRLVSNSTNTTDVGPTANVNTTATTTLPRPYLALWHNASSAFSANSNRAVFQAPEWTCRNVTVDHGVEVGAGIERCIQKVQPTVVTLGWVSA